MMKILVSVSYSPTIEVSDGSHNGHDLSVVQRDLYWELRGIRKYLHHWKQSLKVLRLARDFDALLLCTTGMEAFFVGGLRQRFYPQRPIVVTDFLMPRPNRLVARLAPWLRRIDAFGCIRRGDINELQKRFAVAPEKCFFVPFPANPALATVAAQNGDYLYSAGYAHRDWATLIAAANPLPYPLRVSTGHDLQPLNPQAHIELLGSLPPAEGRVLAAEAGLIVLALQDTLLPSGPLVLLDALALGKAVVASDVNGTRDYVRNGETGILVPPHDVEALRAALDELMRDPQRRQKMGAAARADVQERFTVEHFLAPIIQRLES